MDRCTVQSLRFYLDHLHPDCEALFQQPRSKLYTKSKIWYSDAPIGVNALGNMMSVISEKAGLETRYTNHCIRATTVTSLQNAGMAPSDIVAVTGHRSIASIDSYSRCSDHARRNMSHELSTAVGLKVTDKDKKRGGSWFKCVRNRKGFT